MSSKPISSPLALSSSIQIVEGRAVELEMGLFESPLLYRAGPHPVTCPPAIYPGEVSHFSDDEDEETWLQKFKNPRVLRHGLGEVSKILSYKPRTSSVPFTSDGDKTPRASNVSSFGRSSRSQSQSSVMTSPMRTFWRNVSSSTLDTSWASDEGSSSSDTFRFESPHKPNSVTSTPSSISLSPKRLFKLKSSRQSPVSPLAKLSRRHPRILKPSIYDQFDFGFPLENHQEDDEEEEQGDSSLPDPFARSPMLHNCRTLAPDPILTTPDDIDHKDLIAFYNRQCR